MLLALVCGCNKPAEETKFEVKELKEYFFEVGPYTSLDYEFVNDYFAKSNDNWGGGCSAISAVIDGTRLTGRNMDLNISNKCAYFVKTQVPGKYATVGLAYTFRDFSDDYEVVKANGLKDDFAKILPFMCDDVMNSEGLYIEIDMRHGETDADGNDIFGVEHTNADAEERIYVFTLSQYVALNCKNIAEVKDYLANSVDIYSKKNYWNYCFVLNDAEGNAALLEFGNGRYYWTEPDENGVVAQTNFYVNEECNALEDVKTGLGRYETLMNGIGSVTCKADLFNLMKQVQYSSYYLPYDECKTEHFDPRSEIIGEYEGLTYAVVMDPENEEYARLVFEELNGPIRLLSRAEKQNKNEYWESTFTEVVDAKNKTIEVRLFENEAYLFRLSLDGITAIDAIR